MGKAKYSIGSPELTWEVERQCVRFEKHTRRQMIRFWGDEGIVNSHEMITICTGTQMVGSAQIAIEA